MHHGDHVGSASQSHPLMDDDIFGCGGLLLFCHSNDSGYHCFLPRSVVFMNGISPLCVGRISPCRFSHRDIVGRFSLAIPVVIDR